MNILVHGFHHQEQVDLLDRFADHCHADVVVHICGRDVQLPVKPGRRTEWIAFDDAGNTRYDLSECPPLEGPLMNELRACEAVVMQQMDRLEPWDASIRDYTRRRGIYLKHVRFWNHIITSRQIGLFVGTNVPHEVYDYVIEALCRIHGIPCQFFFQTQIKDVLLPVDDATTFNPSLPLLYEHMCRVHADSTSEEIELPEVMQREWNDQASNTIPFYMDQPSRPDPRNSRLRDEYERACTCGKHPSRFVYFPLHFQPELTTNPLGGPFSDQRVALELLERNLPEDVCILAKEHPLQGWIGRGEGFYADILASCPRVRFVPIETCSHELIQRSMAVATITGTAGWEALFRGRPTILFGNVFFQYAPGVFRVGTNSECSRVLDLVARGEFVYDEKALKLFLMALDAASVNAVLDMDYGRVSRMEASRNKANILDFLCHVAERIAR